MNQLPKNNKPFKVPESYFDSSKNQILDTILLFDKLGNKSVFNTPDFYFDQNYAQITNQLISKEKKVIQISFYKITSIAACLLLSILLPFYLNKENNNFSQTDVSVYITKNIDEYNEYQLGELLNEHELDNLEDELIYDSILN